MHTIVDLSQKTQINSIYGEFLNTIKTTNPEKDLQYWSKHFGAAMPMNWPVFEVIF